MGITSAAIFQGYDQNILRGAVISADQAVRASYDVAVLGHLNPAARVCWDVNSVTITWTLDAPARGDILVIPISNLRTGLGSPSASVIWSNDAGVSQALVMPVPGRNGLPATLVVDLSVDTPDPDDRTSDEWQLTIVGNPSNITIGGAVALYSPKTALVDRDFRWGYARRKQVGSIDTENEFLTQYLQATETVRRSIVLTTLATTRDADELESWFDGCARKPGLLWLDPDVADAYLGVWQPTFARTQAQGTTEAEQITVEFTELSKGIPLL